VAARRPTGSALGHLRYAVRSRIAEYPALYLPFARRKYPGPSPEVVSRETELVIDGYTRCASTFAVYAFQIAQPRPVRVAHHLHAPAQLIAAARSRTPALALIREPKEAILSQLVREPRVALADALVGYARYYERVMPYTPYLVVADFDEVTRDFGAVVRRINARFGTTFVPFEPTEANVRTCLELIRERPSLSPTLLGFESGTVSISEWRASHHEDPEAATDPRRDVWVPSADRERSKAALHREWLRPELASRRARAWQAYEDFRADANGVMR
jgi:hypothetical protein